jgi:hypothetical protein
VKVRNQPQQTVNLAEAIADAEGPEGINRALLAVALDIDDANTTLQHFYDRRLALWRQGRLLGIGPKALAAMSGVTDAAVHQALKRAEKAEELAG